MKRSLLGVLAAIMLFSLMACSSQQSQPAPHPNANKVLFVGGLATDAFIVERLKKMGMEVTVKTDNEVKREDAEGKGLIYISYNAAKGKIGGKFLRLDIPIIHENAKSAVIHSLVKSDDETGTFVHEKGIKTMEIVNEQHPIASGLKGMVDVYTKISNVNHAQPGEEAQVVVTAPGNPKQATLFVYEKGAKDVKGEAMPARQVFYYVFHQSERNMSEDGWKLFEGMVEWAVGKR